MTETFRPTLLVGIGGTGCQIVDTVYQRARANGIDRFGRIGILGFDTDENDMRRLKSLDRRQQIRFSTPDPVYRILRDNPDVLDKWFVPDSRLPTEIRRMTLLDGAGQIRMLTRLALHVALGRPETLLSIKDTIARIARQDSHDLFEGAINVMLVASLAGATGSGSFIQIALILDDLCRESSITPHLSGVFLLGDVYVRAGSLPTEQIANVLANTYASLRELHAVNAYVTKRGGAVGFNYEYVPGRFLRSDALPMRSVTLIDFENSQGGNLGRNIENYKEMAARAVYVQIFSPIGAKVISASINDVRAKMAAAARGATEIYSGVGVSAIVYPINDILEYLTARFALENLQGDWLVLDEMYRRRLQRYIEARDSGDASAREPNRGLAYVEDFDQLARKEQRPFFKRLREQLFPVFETEYGEEQERPQVTTFLDALEQHLIDSFWAVSARLHEAHSRSGIDDSMLEDVDALVDRVRNMERTLEGDWRTLVTAVRDRPDDIFNTQMSSAVSLSPSEWQPHHLQTYLIKGGPHMVQARYFLYALRQEIAQRAASLDPDGLRNSLFGLANAFDPEHGRQSDQRGTPKLLEKARQITERGLLGLIYKRPLNRFRSDFVNYYNFSLVKMRQWVEGKFLERIYQRLDTEVETILRIVDDLFMEIDRLRGELEKQIAEMKVAHEPGAGATFTGTLFVYADRECKQDLWQAVAEEAGGRRLDEAANTAIAQAIFESYRNLRSRRRSDRDELFEAAQLARRTLIDEFARKTLQEQYASLYRFNIMEAIRRESALRKTDWQARFRDLVRIVGGYSEPFLDFVNPNAGQRIMYWAVNDKVRDDYGNHQDFSDTLSYNQGEAPLILPEFSDTELMCMNSRVNLDLTDLKKLHPGDPADDNVNAPAAGLYFQVYDRMIQDLIEADLQGNNALIPHFTPHVHRDWHKLGILPEIFSHRQEAFTKSLYRAFVAAHALEVIDRTFPTGRPPVTFLDLSAMPGGGGFRREIGASHRDWDNLLALRAQPELITAILRYWQAEIERGLQRSFDDWPAAKRLCSPALTETLMRISQEREQENRRDAATLELLTAQFDLIQEVTDYKFTDLSAAGRAQQARETIEHCGQEALANLAKTGVREETRSIIESLYKQSVAMFEAKRRPGGS